MPIYGESVSTRVVVVSTVAISVLVSVLGSMELERSRVIPSGFGPNVANTRALCLNLFSTLRIQPYHFPPDSFP